MREICSTDHSEELYQVNRRSWVSHARISGRGEAWNVGPVLGLLSLDAIGSMYVSGKLPTYPSPNVIFCPKQEVSVNVRFGEGWVGSFPETYIDPHS